MAESKRVQVILTLEQVEALELHAKGQKRSTSNMAAFILEEWLRKNPAAKTKPELLAASIQRTYGFDDQKMEYIRACL